MKAMPFQGQNLK